MDFSETWTSYWNLLHSDITPEQELSHVKPILAHYTSLLNLENILSNDELWLSNPLDMNDLEEVRFGVNSGMEIVDLHKQLREALQTEARRSTFYDALDKCYQEYGSEHVLDLYVACFSVHNPDCDFDGRLSMWRGYGMNGRGAAIVFDTSRLTLLDDSPLALAPIIYGSPRERRVMIENKIEEVAAFIQNNMIPDEYVVSIADALFKRLCLFAIFSKHSGFRDEQEWRLVYFKDRDKSGLLEPFFSYLNGTNGLQLKLKLPVRSINGVIHEDFNFVDITHSIIIGPTSSSLLTKRSAERMLDKVMKPELKKRLILSGIPFRA